MTQTSNVLLWETNVFWLRHATYVTLIIISCSPTDRIHMDTYPIHFLVRCGGQRQARARKFRIQFHFLLCPVSVVVQCTNRRRRRRRRRRRERRELGVSSSPLALPPPPPRSPPTLPPERTNHQKQNNAPPNQLGRPPTTMLLL